MAVFEKFQEALYDILGYIIPSLILLMYIAPLVLLKQNGSRVIYSPAYVLITSGLNDGFMTMINYHYRLQHLVFLVLGLYLLGHIIREGSLRMYTSKWSSKVLNKFSLYKERGELKTKVYEPLEKKAVKYVEDLFEINLNQMIEEKKKCQDLEGDKEKQEIENTKKEYEKQVFELTQSYARATIRTNNINTLVPKYIAKYNLYRSLTFIFVLLGLEAIVSLGIVFLWEVPDLNITKGLFLLMISVISVLIFDYECRRHYELSKKEALFGLIHYIKTEEDSFEVNRTL